MADIKRLLNKKGWTGKELGILELTNMATLFRQRISGNQTPTPLVTKGQFQKMLSSITDSTQGRIYNGYISIHEWLALFYNIALTNEQQAQLRFKSLSSYIIEASIAEDTYSYIESLPVIMTEKQYNEAVEEGRRQWLKEEDGTPRGDSILALIFRAFEYYAEKLEKEPTKANPLKPIRKKYLSQTVKSPFILSRFNEATENGYYVLEDGRRSDQMTDEEWEEAVTTPKMGQALKEMHEAELIQPGFMGITAEEIATQRLIDRANIIYNGGTNWDADKAQEKKDYEAGLAMPAKFVLYDEPPADLTKWDFLSDSCAVYEVYSSSLGGMAETPDEYIAEAEDFIAEFKELVELLLKDIDSKFFKGEPGLSALPVEKWETTVFDWEQLYEKDFYGFRAETDRTDIIWDGNWRAQTNGIAILKPTSFSEKRLDENGYYVPPQIRKTLNEHSLESFFSDADGYADRADEIEEGREALLDSYYFIMGYNTAIDMIASFYEVPELSAFKLNLEGITTKIDALNSLVPMLYMRIKDTQYEDQELKERKLQVLKDFFPPLDYKSLTIPQENIDRVKQLFEDFQAFKGEESISDLMFYRKVPSDDEEGGDADE